MLTRSLRDYREMTVSLPDRFVRGDLLGSAGGVTKVFHFAGHWFVEGVDNLGERLCFEYPLTPQ